MDVLVTGAFGTVGRSAIAACLAAGDRVIALEADRPKTRALEGRLRMKWGQAAARLRVEYGDIRDSELLWKLVQSLEGQEGQSSVIHLAALIPPAADRFPELARSVNVGGTAALLAACRALPRPPRFVLASSVAAYGDRLDDYWISSDDHLAPSPGDEYGRTKVEAEGLVRSSGLDFVILRLGAVMSREKLEPDPLLFSMPLRTRLEILHAEDSGRAFAEAARREGVAGRTLDIGGGQSCRIEYRGFLDRMFRLIGLGGIARFPEAAFAPSGFHCGWFADSDEAEALLGFRRKGLDDYFEEVRAQTRAWRPFAALAAPLLRARMLAASPFWRAAARLPLGAGALP
jgi:nucleoside-diphosphate-sugar epimerase